MPGNSITALAACFIYKKIMFGKQLLKNWKWKVLQEMERSENLSGGRIKRSFAAEEQDVVQMLIID